MSHVRLSALVLAFAFAGATTPAGQSGAQSGRILGLVKYGGGVDTTSLIIRRPPIKSGRVTTAGSQYASVGSWTEWGVFNGSYQYTVNVKSEGTWSASTRETRETLVVSIAGYRDVPAINGTWQYRSTASCPQDPWRFAGTCTGLNVTASQPSAGSGPGLVAAVPYPLSAAGRLSTPEINSIAMTEIVLPQANQTLYTPANVAVKVLVHGSTSVTQGGTVKVELRPYGGGDFPSAAQSGDYISRTVPGGLGTPTEITVDLSGRATTDWQIASMFLVGSQVAARSEWVRFSAKPKVMSAPSSILNIEGESLGATASSAVAVQSMQSFGSGWSGGAQLFWGGGGPGATLTLTFDVPVAGTYAAELYMTRAPDFANVNVTLSGLAPALKFSGHSPKVMPTGPMQMGKFALPAGPNTLTFQISGKYEASTGYRMGFDRIRLYPG